MLRSSWVVTLSLFGACDCGGSKNPVVDAPAIDAIAIDAPSAPVVAIRFPATINRALDVLFVIDNSGSMQAEQQQLAANFPAFVARLQQLAIGLPDLHVGIVSSNVGAAGQPSVPGCPAQGDDGNLLTGPPNNTCQTQFMLTDRYIEDIAAATGGQRERNYTGDLSQLFTCMAQLGTSGCAFEMHLESMYRALQPDKNAGFLRPDAHLAVIFLADEDDCSTEQPTMFGDPNATLDSPLGPRSSFRCHEFGVTCANDPTPRTFGTKTSCRPNPSSPYMFEVERYVTFLQQLKTDPELVTVAGIVGNFDAATGELTVGADPNNAMYPAVQKSCHTLDPNDPDDGATPPVRLQAFLGAFPDRHVVQSICNQNLDGAVEQIADQISAAIVGTSCIDKTLADTEATSGLQPRCTVADVTGSMQTPLARCEVAVQTGTTCDPGTVAAPCWCIHPDATQCPDAPGTYALDVYRGSTVPAAGAKVEAQCEIVP